MTVRGVRPPRRLQPSPLNRRVQVVRRVPPRHGRFRARHVRVPRHGRVLMSRRSRSRSTSRTTCSPASSRARRASRARSSRSWPNATCVGRSSSSANSRPKSGDLVREIACGGHEIALHAFRHDPLTEPRLPTPFARDTKRGRALLEDLAGTEVVGFRAPTFSLVESTRGPPTCSPSSGSATRRACCPRAARSTDSRAAAHAHRWPSGLVELPCPVTHVGPPGGRPHQPVSRRSTSACSRGPRSATGSGGHCPTKCSGPTAIRTTSIRASRWRRAPGLTRTQTWLMWRNRARMFARVDRLLALGAAPPLVERLAEISV